MKQSSPKIIKNYIDQELLYEMIGEQVNKWRNSPSHHFLIEKAKEECWLGSIHCNRDHFGLYGYLRLNFGKQIQILQNLGNLIPIYNPKFVKFFTSSWFKDEVLKNNCISFNFVLEKHILILQNKKDIVNKEINFNFSTLTKFYEDFEKEKNNINN